jgi:hypothetical protein
MGRDLNAHKISRRSTAWSRLWAEILPRTRLFVAYKLGNRELHHVIVARAPHEPHLDRFAAQLPDWLSTSALRQSRS